MPSILYGGIRYSQVRHAIYCKKCKETIESLSDRDFKMCSCNSVGIDGGISSGNRILGKLEDIENRSVYCAYVMKKRIWLPEEVSRLPTRLPEEEVSRLTTRLPEEEVSRLPTRREWPLPSLASPSAHPSIDQSPKTPSDCTR